MIVATSVVAAIFAGYAFSIITQRPHWPFHDYVMYSTLSEEPHYERLRVMGVTADGREIPFADKAYIAPIPLFHLRLAFMSADSHKGDRIEAMQSLCRDTLQRYESRRLAGLHSGPPLHSLRVYEMQWNPLDPLARDAATPTTVTLQFDSALSHAPSGPKLVAHHTGPAGEEALP
ncbi:MAG: hypothetical protein JWL69_4803 [Phycisphaerales bacterium]|nr:hypothetical protein [Phycisphaerales bacterium]